MSPFADIYFKKDDKKLPTIEIHSQLDEQFTISEPNKDEKQR